MISDLIVFTLSLEMIFQESKQSDLMSPMKRKSKHLHLNLIPSMFYLTVLGNRLFHQYIFLNKFRFFLQNLAWTKRKRITFSLRPQRLVCEEVGSVLQVQIWGLHIAFIPLVERLLKCSGLRAFMKKAARWVDLLDILSIL